MEEIRTYEDAWIYLRNRLKYVGEVSDNVDVDKLLELMDKITMVL